MRNASHHRVLLVDDHEDSREVLLAALYGTEFDVEGLADAETALARARAERPDVLVTDLTLPGMSGEALVRAVRALPGGEHVRVVALSGRDAQPGSAFDRVLRKPLDPTRLAPTLRQLMAVRTAPLEETSRAIPAAVGRATRGAHGGPAIVAPSSAPPRAGRERLTLDQCRLLAEHVPTMAWRAGPDAKCDWFNATWLEFTGRTYEEECGDGWAAGVHPADLERCLACYRTSFEARDPFEVEYRLRRHDGVYRWVLDRGVPILGEDGTFGGFIGSCIDIDDRRRDAEGKARFFSTMAHELRTPLTPMTAYVHQLERVAARGAAVDPELVTKFTRQMDRLLQLVDHLADAARLDAGSSLTLQRESVDVASLVREAVTEQQQALARVRSSRPPPTVELLDVAGAIPADVDPVRVRQALRHVLRNAVKFSSAGGAIGVEVRAERDVTIEIADRGIGVPEGELPRVATSYFRGSNAPVSNYPGAGMGLAVTKQILTSHGGSLEVRGREGGGTTVVLRLPRRPAES